MRLEIFSRIVAVLLAAVLSACATIDNAPINVPIHGVPPSPPSAPLRGDKTVAIGLAFSGGGTRAAAFSFGVLKQLAATANAPALDLLDQVDFVSGVSGGSITAAYYGYRGGAALADFRDKFLIQDVESSLTTNPFDPRTVIRALAGGVNDRRGMQAWLDAHLFDHQTFAALDGTGKPLVWINASDIYNQTPFVFDDETFGALCSDLSKLPISEAVAASAAVPIAFAPIVIQSYPSECDYQPPPWITAALQPNATASDNLQSYARALKNYRDPDTMRYVKLLDGGLIDNYGLAGLVLRREELAEPYAPLTPEEAVALKQLLFVVVDAGQSTSDAWVKTASGPSGAEIVSASMDTALVAGKRGSYDLFIGQMDEWKRDLIAYRCGLTKDDVVRLGGDPAGWKCDGVQFYVARVSFSLLDPAEAKRLSRLPTTLSLSAADVDALIAGGGEALTRSPAFQNFLKDLGAPPPRVSLLEQ
jgi:NTE family protein